ncbi:oxidative stress-responsive serine-rich protein 1 isoform X1 [Ischnura elegans]|uniref:oxidative stress-responsive serine-rich protein 1 isoform X1 n=1 Tax=Ischnura elegans TaxID=197161 RepID=UPI001ED8BD3A|nr:oxidative stress-responsive serine-rich protein 1 isoform X1 [Ischnura elegans]
MSPACQLTIEKMPEVSNSVLDNSTEVAFEKLTFTGEECPRISCKCNVNEVGKSKCGRRSKPKCPRTDSWHSRKVISHSTKSRPFLFRRSKLKFVHFKVHIHFTSGSTVLRDPILQVNDCVKSNSSPNLLSLSPPVTPLRSSGTSPPRTPLREQTGSPLLPALPVPNSLSSSVKCCSFTDNESSQEDFKSLAAGVQGASQVPLSSSVKKNHNLVGREAASFKDLSYRVLRPVWKKPRKRTQATAKSFSDGEEGKKVTEVVETSSSAIGGLPASLSSSTSCSQQARMSPLNDITINELAGYFDTFVHIPKKMSQMAEMMYT